MIDLSIQNVVRGSAIVSSVNHSMHSLGEITEHNTESVVKIHRSPLEQSRTMEEIALGISQISNVVQTNSATAEETAASVEQTSAQSDVLNGIISRFTLRDKQAGPVALEEKVALQNVVVLPSSQKKIGTGFTITSPTPQGKY